MWERQLVESVGLQWRQVAAEKLSWRRERDAFALASCRRMLQVDAGATIDTESVVDDALNVGQLLDARQSLLQQRHVCANAAMQRLLLMLHGLVDTWQQREESSLGRLCICGDSRLVVEPVVGSWRTSASNLAPMAD
eukprot:4749713-Karenia_brevis.AAC.1